MLNVCVCLSRMCCLILSQPQPSSRDLLYVKCLCFVPLSQPSRDLLYVKCFCVLPRYLSPVVEICYTLNVFVFCLVISAQ